MREALYNVWRSGEDFRRSFERADTGFTGKLRTGDFERCLDDAKLGLSSSEKADLVKVLDSEKSGKIDYLDFLRRFSPMQSRPHTLPDNAALLRDADKLRLMITHRARAKRGNLRSPFKHFALQKREFDQNDLADGLEKLAFNITPRETRTLFKMMDHNGDGKVTFSEFCIFVRGSRYYEVEDRLRLEITRNARDIGDEHKLRRVFEKLDRDDVGELSASDFSSALRKMGLDFKQHEVDLLMIRFDRDGSGRISYREFLEFCGKRLSRYEDVASLRDRIAERIEDYGSAIDVFEEMDSDGNGVLDEEEFRRGLQKLGLDLSPSEVRKVMAYFDFSDVGRLGTAVLAIHRRPWQCWGQAHACHPPSASASTGQCTMHGFVAMTMQESSNEQTVTLRDSFASLHLKMPWITQGCALHQKTSGSLSVCSIPVTQER